MELQIFQVDSFAEEAFQGNPAAVVILEEWLPDLVMQAIASEMNLSETAFAVRKGKDFKIRWFTPAAEVDLCGHATLATAHVLYRHYNEPHQELRFQSRSGLLSTSITGDKIILDFPLQKLTAIELESTFAEIVGGSPKAAFETKDLVLVYEDSSEVEILEPDFHRMAALGYQGVAATAINHTNDECDFVARFFAPAIGINEDPVTGSIYTYLTPYYAEQTGKSEFKARQVSRRGGNVGLSLNGDRVNISGHAKTIMSGTFYLGKAHST